MLLSFRSTFVLQWSRCVAASCRAASPEGGVCHGRPDCHRDLRSADCGGCHRRSGEGGVGERCWRKEKAGHPCKENRLNQKTDAARLGGAPTVSIVAWTAKRAKGPWPDFDRPAGRAVRGPEPATASLHVRLARFEPPLRGCLAKSADVRGAQGKPPTTPPPQRARGPAQPASAAFPR